MSHIESVAADSNGTDLHLVEAIFWFALLSSLLPLHPIASTPSQRSFIITN
jgi:hypothetical protein